MWFNGGPGCSSMEGLFQENGPIVVDDDTHSIYHNNHSWNAKANVLYFDSPALVGFSKASKASDKKHSDLSTS
jgi:carboxypeptidase C (cathepsin A)